jgi:23S rRNA G2445 N2-methylase RlmL
VTPDERLLGLVADPGFTPKKRDVTALVTLLGHDDEDVVRKVERALMRKPDDARAALLAAITSSSTAEPVAVRACRVLPRVLAAEHTDAVDVLLPLLTDERKRLRRAAERALGNMQDARIEAALAGAFELASDPGEQKVLADALGKVGGARGRAVLEGAATGDDALLVEKQTRARLAIERTIKRGTRARIDPTRAPARPIAIAWRCRDGLEELLANELGIVTDKKKPQAGRVEGTLRGPLVRAAAARLASDFVFPLPLAPDAKDDVADAVVNARTSDDARAVIDAFSPDGDVTVRVAWRDAGHKRSVTWQVAEKLSARGGRLRNDPRDATWEASVRVFRDGVRVELVPRALDDERFSWRVRDVPAASHPTIAAALARVAHPHAGDVVWDPFCGSGAELVECALSAGRDLTLFGTDTEESALDAARTNLAAANFEAELVKADALTWTPPRAPTLVITNPPMGRRVQRTKELPDILDAFIRHVARKMAPHGRIVWLAPHPEKTRAVAKKLGLTIAYSRRVDLGGFFAELMRLET